MCARRSAERDGRDCPSRSRFALALRALSIALVLSAFPAPLLGQLFARPWLDWHTVSSGRFDVHYPTELTAWAQFVAARLPAIDSAVTTLVGYSPRTRVQIIVEDPFDIS